MRVNAASLDIRDATTSTPGTLNDLTTDLIMANNNNLETQVSELMAVQQQPMEMMKTVHVYFDKQARHKEDSQQTSRQHQKVAPPPEIKQVQA